MHKIAIIAARADSFCARLNDGLTAVAIALAIVTGALSALRVVEVGVTYDPEWSVAEGIN